MDTSKDSKYLIRRMLIIALAVVMVLILIPTNTSYAFAKAPKVKKISMNKSVYTIKKGKTYQLKVNVSPKKYAKNVVWKSSNSKIVSVSKKGKIKARRNGKAVITAKVKGSNKKATCKIIVGKPIKKIKLNTYKRKLYLGDKLQLKVSFSPSKPSVKKVKYASSDKSVAKVSSSGLIKAVGQGRCKIIVKSTDGTGKKAVCIVAVSKKCRIKFVTNTDTTISDRIIDAGKTLSPPKELVKEGYEFDGWYTDKYFGNPYYFDTPVESSMTLYAKWRKVTASTFKLSSNKADVLIGESDTYYDFDDEYYEEEYIQPERLRFFLESDIETYGIDLYESGTDEYIATMADDGDYEYSGDEIAGDGIYTAYVDDITYQEETISLYAQCEAPKNTYTSNEVAINFYLPIEDDVLESMDEVNAEIDNLTESDEYIEMDEPARAQAVEELLGELSAIDQTSVIYEPDTGLIYYTYVGGCEGVVHLRDFDSEFNNTKTVREERRAAEAWEQETAQSTKSLLSGSAGSASAKGDALILNGFPAFETEAADIAYRTDFYTGLRSRLNAKGLTTTLDTNVTVEDFKRLADYNFVSISTHGSTYSGQPAICLAESATSEKNKKYSVELKTKQIVQSGSRYWILPEFFNRQYNSTDLAGTLIFSECCEFMGRNGNDNYAMADALTGSGAPAVAGFHNSVLASYSREFMECYADNLISGKTTGEAHDAGISKIGRDHATWYESEYGTPYRTYYEQEYGTGSYIEANHNAKPRLRGDRNATLYSVAGSIANGGFEKVKTKNSNLVPEKWSLMGDVRTLGKLSLLSPTEGYRMTIITTGIGSKETSALSDGTEGSMIYQDVRIPGNANQIQFDYNYVSEEPMEYVGSQFNDRFAVQIIKNGSVVYEKTLESINTSNWKAIGGIDFAGGDSTTYHTAWKTGKIDVSAYRNNEIRLRFVIVDVGDSLYDSAALIDKVVITK